MTFGLLVVCLGLSLSSSRGQDDASTGVDVDQAAHDEYAQRKQAAKLDPKAQVSLALWCERHGMTAERNRHLALAAQRNPDDPRIRSLLGQIPDGDGWKRADQALLGPPADDPIRDEYQSRRDQIADDAKSHEKLADWCAQNGLEDEADAHLRAALRIDPQRAAVWRKLGYRRVNGRWTNDATLAYEKQEAEAQKEADEFWNARLVALLKDRNKPAKRAEAQAELDAIRDPRAIPAIWKQAILGKHADAEAGVRLLSQQDSPRASRLIALMAVQHNSDRIRNQSAQILHCRDPREFAGALIEAMGTPIAYEVRPVNGPGSPGVLFIDGERAFERRTYAPPTMLESASDMIFVPGPDGIPAAFLPAELNRIAQRTINAPRNSSPGATGLNMNTGAGTAFDGSVFLQAQYRTQYLMLESMRTAQVAQAKLANDVAQLERRNEAIREVNARIQRVLSPFTDLGPDADRDQWRAWYQDSLGYRYRPTPRPFAKPVIDVRVPIVVTPAQFAPITQSDGRILAPARRSSSCFAPGTPVHTRDGLVPIERIRVGDQLLSVDTRTGRLGYKPVVVVLHNPPAETLRIQSGGETVTATTIHRFWKAGEGWSLARDLHPGDSLRGIRGAYPIESIEPGKTTPVFNLEVADNGTFFVGETGRLVRDHTLPDLRELPYDAPTSTQPQREKPAETTARR